MPVAQCLSCLAPDLSLAVRQHGAARQPFLALANTTNVLSE